MTRKKADPVSETVYGGWLKGYKITPKEVTAKGDKPAAIILTVETPATRALSAELSKVAMEGAAIAFTITKAQKELALELEGERGDDGETGLL